MSQRIQSDGTSVTIEELGPEQTKAITMEIDFLGRAGFRINEPEKRYNLKSLKGDFSGLQLVSYMYVGLKQIAPEADPGIDLSKEYATALDFLKGRDVPQQS